MVDISTDITVSNTFPFGAADTSLMWVCQTASDTIERRMARIRCFARTIAHSGGDTAPV